MYEDVHVERRTVMRADDEKWQYWRCLYVYVCPTERDILYLGKADRCTVRERWIGADKRSWRDWAIDQDIERVHLHVGMIDWGDGARYTPEKLADVETLLIKRLRPRGNVQAIQNRVCRPGVRVLCGGNWPHKRTAFVDA